MMFVAHCQRNVACVPVLSVDPLEGVAEIGATRPEPVGSVRWIGISERYSAHDSAVLAEPEMVANEIRMCRERGLRDGAESEALRGQEERLHVQAAVNGAVNP